MAEEHKPVELSKETKLDTPLATEAGAADIKPAQETIAPAQPVTTVEDTPVAAETTDVTKDIPTETKVEETKPVEEGHLAHKAQGKSFPK